MPRTSHPFRYLLIALCCVACTQASVRPSLQLAPMSPAEESLLVPVVQAVLDSTRYRGQGIICIGARTAAPTSAVYTVPVAVVNRLSAGQPIVPVGAQCAPNRYRDESLSVQFEFYGDTRIPRRVAVVFGSTWRTFTCNLETTWQCRATQWSLIAHDDEDAA